MNRKRVAQLCLAVLADGTSAYALAQVDVPARAAQYNTQFVAAFKTWMNLGAPCPR